MTSRPDDHLRPLLGAFVLGHLEPAEASAVRGHLDVCRACRRDAAELAPVADLLPLADPERIGTTAGSEPPREMLDAVLGASSASRAVVGAARSGCGSAAVAAALVIVTVFATIASDPSEPRGGELVAMVAAQPGVIGEAVVHEDPRSTWVELTTSGLAAGETYAVWLEEVGTGLAPRSAPSSVSRATSTSACTRPCLGSAPPRSASARPTEKP